MKTLKPVVERTDWFTAHRSEIRGDSWPTAKAAKHRSRVHLVVEVGMSLHVKRVTNAKDYMLHIEFTNGALKDVDLLRTAPGSSYLRAGEGQ
jgi:hypothetical protein